MSKGNLRVGGTYVGTGASIDIELGFAPDKIEIVNITDNNIKAEHWVGRHAVGASFDTTATGAVNNAAGSISPFAGARASKSLGFSTGADNSVSEKTYAYTAYSGDV